MRLLRVPTASSWRSWSPTCAMPAPWRRAVTGGVGQVFRFAAQSPGDNQPAADPQEDFLVNAQGTLNVLEAIHARARCSRRW